MVRASSFSAAGLALACAASCTAGKTVSLGHVIPPPYHFDTPQIVAELAVAGARTDNPTLTGDLLEIYFTTDRASGNGDVWFAKRANETLPFEAPTPVTAVNTDGFETSSAISTDGLTLWFGSDRPGGAGANDVWVTTRPSRGAGWSTPVNVVALNSPFDDIPRPPGQHGLVMPLASQRKDLSTYETYFATRSAPGAPFGSPVEVQELVVPGRSTVDGFLTDDGLTMFYSSAGSDSPGATGDAATPATDAGATDGAVMMTSDLYVAWRRFVDDGFSDTQPLDDLNTSGDERDPWLTPDGSTLYFTSDRSGTLAIYTARVLPR